MEKKNLYNEVLAELEKVFNGSTMDVYAAENKITLTLKGGLSRFLEILIYFQDEQAHIEGWYGVLWGCLKADVYYGEDFVNRIKDSVITIFSDCNAEIMREMFN